MGFAAAGTLAGWPTPVPIMLVTGMPPVDSACPVISGVPLAPSATEVTMILPRVPTSNAAPWVTSAETVYCKLVPREARFEPCLLSPDITCLSWITREMSMSAKTMTKSINTQRMNSSIAWPCSRPACLGRVKLLGDLKIILPSFFCLAGWKGLILNLDTRSKRIFALGKQPCDQRSKQRHAGSHRNGHHVPGSARSACSPVLARNLNVRDVRAQ